MACGDRISSLRKIKETSKFSGIHSQFIHLNQNINSEHCICRTDLESISTSNGSVANGDTKHAFFGKLGTPAEVALKADSLCKTYDGVHDAVKDVTFSVKSGEVMAIIMANILESII